MLFCPTFLLNVFQNFTGNADVNTVVESKIVPPIVARYVRIHPGYMSGKYVCLRLELYGCLNKEGLLCTVAWGYCLMNYLVSGYTVGIKRQLIKFNSE